MAGEDGEEPIPADLSGGDAGECSVDLATGKVVLTGPLAELFGSAEDQPLALEDLRGRIHPGDRQRIADEIAAALGDAATSTVRTRFRVVRRDGSATWLEARDRIARDGDGRAVATRGVMRAVTGRKRCDEPDHDRSRFEAALANTSIVLFQQDLALRYTWIHDARRGFEAQSMLGRTDADLAGPDIAGQLDAVKRKAIETGRSARSEVTMQGRDGRGRFDLHVEPRRDDFGAVIGITGAAIEIAAEHGRRGGPSQLRQAISDRHALLDRLEARSEPGSDAGSNRGLFTICTELLRRKLAGHAPLTRDDAVLLGLMEGKRRFVAARQPLDIGADRTLLIGNGWVYSYRALANGDRQVVGFHLPGDLIGDAQPGGKDSSYVAVTDCVVCEFDRAMAMKLRRSETVLPDALRWSDAREAAIVQQHLISIGRRSAIARVAHLLLELGARLKLVGLAEDDGYRCPLSQELLGDALGLTKIHVNRMLRELRELGCLTLRNGRVTYGDMARLVDLADYDPAYLDVSPGPAPTTGLRA